jgi:hypothetical protein
MATPEITREEAVEAAFDLCNQATALRLAIGAIQPTPEESLVLLRAIVEYTKAEVFVPSARRTT